LQAVSYSPIGGFAMNQNSQDKNQQNPNQQNQNQSGRHRKFDGSPDSSRVLPARPVS